MKLIAPGQPSTYSWFIGKQGTCSSCGARVEFDEADKAGVHMEPDFQSFPFGRRCLDWTCPDCGRLNVFPEPREGGQT